MREQQYPDLEQHNRNAFEEGGPDGRQPSKALQEAISNSRKHIEAAFRHSMSEEKLGQLKIKVKTAAG
jgi:hypothetical protein